MKKKKASTFFFRSLEKKKMQQQSLSDEEMALAVRMSLEHDQDNALVDMQDNYELGRGRMYALGACVFFGQSGDCWMLTGFFLLFFCGPC